MPSKRGYPLKHNKTVGLLLLTLLVLSAGCQGTSWENLPVVSQLASATPTPTPLPTATPTSVPAASPSATPTVAPPTTASPIASATLPPSETPVVTMASLPTSTPTAEVIITSVPKPTVTSVEIARGDAQRPWIALTFDAGADISPLQSILDTLRLKDVHCTFFLTGIALRQAGGPELLQQLVADGHELGNHSDTHPDFRELTDEQMGLELAKVEDAVLAVTGHSTKPYFRPPFGGRDDRVRRVVAENGYLNIYWTYDVRDWTEDRTAEEIYNLAVGRATNGAIVVMHVGAWETAAVLPAIIDELRSQGYRLVTLSELLSP
jgi:peptidoglycan/xylan/chitin deacetylase (PgdA/CDA1 family)